MHIDIKTMDQKTKDQLVAVIEATNILEEQAGAVVRKLCLPPPAPDNSQLHILFHRLLHNTILSLGAKVTFIKGVVIDHFRWKDLKRKVGVLDEVLRLRNAFAHTPTSRKAVVSGPITVPGPAGVRQSVGIVAEHLLVETRQHGSVKYLLRDEAFKEFQEKVNMASILLIEICHRVDMLSKGTDPQSKKK